MTATPGLIVLADLPALARKRWPDWGMISSDLVQDKSRGWEDGNDRENRRNGLRLFSGSHAPHGNPSVPASQARDNQEKPSGVNSVTGCDASSNAFPCGAWERERRWKREGKQEERLEIISSFSEIVVIGCADRVRTLPLNDFHKKQENFHAILQTIDSKES